MSDDDGNARTHTCFGKFLYLLSVWLRTTMAFSWLPDQPAESDSGLFGGNSNWRGPIWFALNFLIIESLQKFHHYYGDDFVSETTTRRVSR